ncbi:phasin family protein [Marinobacter sp. CHS3-4]|uniref:phasin family protein n=1 Tax=Marinobacter sp. CHS3-4 TaxID=3045174 RepID=UPI0024B5554F|nr:phasin family protein [Marinobacter sp. CHS3-4]MDI9246720.1 phasin family protein [Marinobacter sp. CHS3-4]
MPNELFSGLNDRSRDFMERTAHFNEALFHQFSKAAELQMEALRRYTDIASEQARKLASVRDLEDIKEVSEGQVEALKKISDQMSSDWQAWQDYFTDARDQLKSSIVDEQEKSSSPQPASKKQ